MSILDLIAKAQAAQQRLAPLLRASTQSPAGEVLTRALNAPERRAIEDATVLIRRKSLADLKEGRLKSVHESKRTGASSGPKRSAEVRAAEEPQMFGDKGQTYGYLTDDPFATLKGRFRSYYPERGAAHFAPESTIPQYGQYALELHPENRARTTFTLDDSLDRTKGHYALADNLLRGDSPHNDSAVEGSMLYALARYYSQARKNAIEQLGLQHAGALYGQDDISKVLQERGLPSKFGQLMEQYGLNPLGDGGGTSRLARQVPRMLTELENSPLMRSELYSLGDPASLEKKLSLRDLNNYVEAQIHGDVTPEHVKRIYDLNYEPSLATEKAVKKLGIEYVPRPTDTVYDKIQAQNPRTMGELYDLQDSLGVSPQQRVLQRGRTELDPELRENLMLPFKVGFARGGLAQVKECSCHG